MVTARVEEWPDADFDLPEGAAIHPQSDRDLDDEDWDIELNLSPRKSHVAAISARTITLSPPLFTIRPPITLPDIDDVEDDDEGASTIKVTELPSSIFHKSAHPPIEEDFEDAFALPSDLTQLSLAPLSLSHRSSKNSLEWGDKDQTSSSQSSDAYSSLGFADASPSSNSTSVSLPDSETDLDEDELDGLVLPSSLFESGHSGRQLNNILDMKKKAQVTDTRPLKIAAPDPEDDFESGLVFDDDAGLNPKRLLLKTQHSLRPFQRSHTVPQQRQSAIRPPSRLNRSKSPLNPPPSSTRQLQKIRLSPSPPLRGPTRSQTFQALSSATPAPSPSSFLSPKPGSLRGQKSYSGLKPPTPPASMRGITRKASLSSLIELSHGQASGSGQAAATSTSKARYEEPTVASRAKSHKYSTSRTQDLKIPPTRPSTPSSNPAALRLTMPSQSRLKVRPALSGVFGPSPPPPQPISSPPRATSPLPPRPPSTSSLRRSPAVPQPVAPKVLKRPKRQRLFGDGTELDAFEDLPTDREKEVKFRVQPKGTGNRAIGGAYSSEKGTMKKKGRREGSSGESMPLIALAPSTNTLRRTSRMEFPPKGNSTKPSSPKATKKKAVATPSPQTRRKPTLIRNLGRNNGPKVIGDMRWNPSTLRWEGNDHILRDFDATIGTSTRPALITHLTGSSMGSPVGSFASGARIVGNMIFDPSRMCWISTLPPDEEEPDVFANLADDEDDWEVKGGTIRASLQQPSGSDTSMNTPTVTSGDNSSTSSMHVEAPSPARSHTRTISESGSERGSRASMIFDIDETFIENCRAAEERHRVEMKGWRSALAPQDVFSDQDRSHLYEIRALATRNLNSEPVPRHQAGPGVGRISLVSYGSSATFSEMSYTYPLKLLAPRISQDGIAVVYLLTYGGGLVGGDEVQLSVDVDSRTMLVLLSQGSTKVFKTRPGRRLASVKSSGSHAGGVLMKLTTIQSMTFRIAAGGALLLLPDPVTCFRSASYNQTQKFYLSENASIVVLDWITSGRMSMGEEWAFSRYYSANEVWVEGKRVAKDVMLLDHTEEGIGEAPSRKMSDRLKPYSCYAMVILCGPIAETTIEHLNVLYDQITIFKAKAPADMLWSLSLMTSGPGAIIRVAGKETETVKRWLAQELVQLQAVVGRDVYEKAFQ
ncbi:hypothetical protein H0H93_015227 [Arthromyces matolae]|nr:hypothetical protein H0H93_015227 [Arthromyces matolae]